jgi:mono/diheme cytochrome c family protein
MVMRGVRWVQAGCVGLVVGFGWTGCARGQQAEGRERGTGTAPGVPQAVAAAPAAPQGAGPKKLNPFTGDSAAIAEGQKLWMKYNCYGCHGTQAGGGMGASLVDELWTCGGDDRTVFNSIKNGCQRMPPVGTLANIPDEEIWKIIAYVRSLYKGDPSKIVW